MIKLIVDFATKLIFAAGAGASWSGNHHSNFTLPKRKADAPLLLALNINRSSKKYTFSLYKGVVCSGAHYRI